MAAQDAELKLKVSLDLAFFRTQLASLGETAAGYKLPINIKFDRVSVQNELTALGRILGRKTYDLQVNDTTIKTARTNAQKLKNTLDLLNKTKVTIDLGTKRTGASLEDLESLFSKGKTGQAFGGGAVQQARQNVARQSLISRLEQKSLSAGGYNVPGLKRVVEELGGKPTGGRSDLVAQAKKLAQEADDALINRVWSSVKDLQMNMRYAGGGGYGVGQSISRMINSMSLASSNPYAARQQLRSLPPKYITTELAGRASEQAMANQALGQTGAPVSAKFQNSFDKYLEAVVGQAMADASIARQRYMARTSPLQQLIPTVPERSYFQYRGTPLLPPARGGGGMPPLLPPSGGTGGGGEGPSRGGALGFRFTELPKNYLENARKYAAALDIARNTMSNFRASQLPFVGGLQGIASEFALATKQVLLYGTAYRGLAFITSIPGQVLNAAKSQQQFNNALQTATQDTGTFAKELLYVDNVQRAFGLNLETTRSGFTRLYASMAPTGFDSGSIEKLFTGISAATAALQLTPDKAERVIYAFGQMASKGQIMSEELKGQLGDVLPGALALFAKAAGMSVKEFSKAMEDGEFVGRRFREVFAKVSDELINRFGTGAQAAGKSLQGLLNTVQGDFQRTLESFAPLANAAAQAILGPLAGSLKQLSMSAKIATGEIERTFSQLQQAQRDVGDLRAGGASAEQIKAAEQNVAVLTARYKTLQAAAADPAIAKQAEDIEKFTEELAKAGSFVMNVARTIGNTLSPVLNLLGTNLTTVIGVLTSFYVGFQAARLAAMALMGALMLLRGVSALLGLSAVAQQATAVAGAFNVLGVAATGATVTTVGLRAALIALTASTFIGAVFAGIMLVVGAFAAMRDRAKEAAQASREAAKAAIEAGQSGNVPLAEMKVQEILGESRKNKAAREALERIYARSTRQQRQGSALMTIGDAEAVALKGSPLTEKLIKGTSGGRRQIQVPPPADYEQTIRQFGSVAGQNAIDLREAKSALNTARTVAQQTGQNIPGVTKPGTGDDEEKQTTKNTRLQRKYVDAIQNTYEKEKARLGLRKQNGLLDETQYKIALSNLNFETAKTRAAAAYQEVVEDINASKMTAGDKEIALADALLAKNEKIAAAKFLNQTELQAATKELTQPLVDRIKSENLEINKQTAEINNLANGYEGLTIEQQADFIIQEQLLKLSGREKEAIKDTIDELRNKIRTSLELNKTLQIERRIKGLRDEIAALRAINAEERARLRIRQENQGVSREKENQIYELEKVRDNIKATREIIDNFVNDTSSDYKGFLKAVISGEDAADALEKFQAGLKDRVLTIFLDFTMKPVEDFFKDVVGGKLIEKLFPQSALEKGQGLEAKSTDPVQATNENTNATTTNTTAIQNLTNALNGQVTGAAAGNAAGFNTFDTNILSQGMQSTIKGMDPGVGFGAGGGLVGAAAFSQELGDISTGLQNAMPSLTGFSEAINGFSINSVDSATQTIKAGEEMKKGTSKFAEGLGNAVQGIAVAASAVMNIAAGIKQIEKGDTASVLGGIGSILMGVGGAIGGFMNIGKKAANGAVWKGGFQAFANGGLVQGPTLGLVGEGKYNEAIVPLPDGRSIPVQMQGDSIRDRMGGSSNGGGMASPMLSMSFETTTINNVEYVSREQLEQAMMETRKLAVRDGARQGANLAIDKLQQSPNTRRRIGI